MPPPMMRRIRFPERVIAAARSSRLQRRLDVGMDEIVALEKERKLASLGESVRETVPHVEIGRMARAAPISVVGGASGTDLDHVERNDLRLNQREKFVY